MDTEKERGKEMRSLIATIVLCCIMILAATANFVYVNHIADEMIALADALPSIDDPSCIEKTDELCKTWKKNVSIVGLTVGFLTIDKLSEYCETLHACAQVGDVYGYQTALTLLYDSIDDVRRLEQFSIGNLF